nr:DNA/RNA non-specific endonuclease [Lachnospiraceae bacterium]
HLIGYQLTGENANEKNLITGTRYMNVDGMLPFEDLVDDYLEWSDYHVLYRVTPIFEGDNLVASGVLMEGWSVEDQGLGICFNVFCYNVQPGIVIDYATGDSYATEAVSEENDYNTSDNATDNTTEESAENTGQTYSFVLNTNTKKFHISTCSSVADMADHNKQYYEGTVQEVIDMGYTPCKRCLGEYAN